MTLKELVEQLDTDIEDFEESYYYLTVENLLKYLKKLSFELERINKLSPFNDIAKEHFNWVESKNWHNKTVLECLALIASEVGEAINEARGKELTDNFKYELVDILLRVFDLAHQYHIDLDKVVKEKMLINKNRDFSKKLK